VKVVPDWREMNSVLRVIIVSSFAGFLLALVFISCADEYYIGKAKEDLYKEMFEVDSLMMQIQLQLDSTSIDFEKFYIDAQRINNGHE
jgi:phosphate/sulfate permease|tara:strand:- start:1572 stop:1835 length:264 start_codon:yes stop_codon:yes gene_type:complete